MTIQPLRKYRQDNKLTQSEAAQQFDVSRETWALWELGRRRIGKTKLATVSERTGIPKPELRPDLAELLGAQ